ncbi:hypothetical protein SGLAM104S_07061 [Streptomyces glaucescens]
MSYCANLSASSGFASWYSRVTSATVRQKSSSARIPSEARFAARKRKKQSKTSVKIDSSLVSSGTSTRIRRTSGGSTASGSMTAISSAMSL